MISTPDIRSKYKKIADEMDHERLKLCYETDIYDAGALIAQADLLISVDTSLIHIASAEGTKVLGIYSNAPKFYESYGPKFVKFKIITQKKPSQIDHELHDYSVDELVTATAELLA